MKKEILLMTIKRTWGHSIFTRNQELPEVGELTLYLSIIVEAKTHPGFLRMAIRLIMRSWFGGMSWERGTLLLPKARGGVPIEGGRFRLRLGCGQVTLFGLCLSA